MAPRDEDGRGEWNWFLHAIGVGLLGRATGQAYPKRLTTRVGSSQRPLWVGNSHMDRLHQNEYLTKSSIWSGSLATRTPPERMLMRLLPDCPSIELQAIGRPCQVGSACSRRKDGHE